MTRKRLTILGTGFSAFSLIKNIDVELHDITVVSPRNHFLFSPLLPSTTVGTLEFRSIIEPIRVARQGIRYYQAACVDIDTEAREIVCEGTVPPGGDLFRLPYDRLVMAMGAVSNTFGVPGVEEHALFLKELADARAIRQGIIECFERASAPDLDPEQRRHWLRFLVVGGGPTGVEFAAELHDFLREDLRKWYPDLGEDVQIILLEASDQILGTFDKTLSEYAGKLFKRSRIDVRTGTVVERVEEGRVCLKGGGEVIGGLIVWSTGIAATPLVKKVGFKKDARDRLVTDAFFRVQGEDGIYAIGDGAVVDGEAFPATAQTAQQEGKHLARILDREARGREAEPFRYRHLGMLAYIGRHRALADLPHVKGRGFTAWLFWRSAYITKLVSFKNKILVVFDWAKTLVFGRDISRF